MRKNFAELLLLINKISYKLDIIALTEINIKEDEVPCYQIPNYTSYSITRKKQKGGGICVYIRTSLIFEKSSEESFLSYELLSGFIHTKTDNIHIYIIYRPPKTKQTVFLQELDQLLRHAPERERAILMGDINIDLMERSNTIVNTYEDLLSNYGYERYIYGYTREEFRNGILSQSCLDHIFVKNEKCEVLSGIITHKLADHYFVSVSYQDLLLKSDVLLSFISVLNNKSIQNDLIAVNWSELVNLDCPIVLYNTLVKIFQDIYDKNTRCMSKKTVLRASCAWMDLDLKNMIKHKDALFKRCKQYPNNKVYRLEYNRWRNKTKKLINKKQNLYKKQQLLDSGNDYKKYGI